MKVIEILQQNGYREVICQKWEESERGWGVRTDGFSLHASGELHKRYCADFWIRQKELLGESAPDEYTREDGLPYKVYVSTELYNKLATVDGLRFWTKYPLPNEIVEV